MPKKVSVRSKSNLSSISDSTSSIFDNILSKNKNEDEDENERNCI